MPNILPAPSEPVVNTSGKGSSRAPRPIDPFFGMNWAKAFTGESGQQFPTGFEEMQAKQNGALDTKQMNEFLAGGGSPFDISSFKAASETPIGATNAQNTAQGAKQSSQSQQSHVEDVNKMHSGDYGSISEAFKAAQEAFKPYAGRGIGGSEDVRVRADVYGRPYTTVSVSPTEKHGIESGMGRLEGSTSPRPIQQSSEMKNAISMAAKRFKAKKSGQSGIEYGFDESMTGNPYK